MKRIQSLAAIALAAICFAVGLTGCGQPAGTPRVTTSVGLYPVLFQAAVLDYVNRCDPSTPTTVNVDAPAGTTVSVNGSTPRSGRFNVQVAQQVGRRFTIGVTTDGTTRTHSVRCLPTDFPTWTAERTGTTQAQFYATTMFQGFSGNYTVVFDTNGVPIWWLPRKPTILLAPLPNRNFAILKAGGGMEEYNLNGQVVRTLNTFGAASDFHDALLLPNGNYVLATIQQQPCDLSSWGLTGEKVCLNHVFQELTPQGVPVWQWDTAANIPVTETTAPWRDSEINGGAFTTPGVYDPFHYNSVEYTGDGFILSFRHLDAVYKINRATGAVDWKIGGTLRRESFSIVGDPLRGFSGQHDARLLGDGTLTLHDNGTLGRGPTRQPRAVGYRVDVEDRTATLVEERRDPEVSTSPCCGSARILPRGAWVIGWGGTNQISEYRVDGTRVFKLTVVGDVGVVYRGLPLLPGQYSATQFRAGMDAQYGTG